MLPAILTTLLWSYCLMPARRSVAQLGGNAANVWRLLVAVIVMGIIAAAGGLHLNHAAYAWFFLSGIIGFGFGDIGVFFALPRLGSRLTLLMAQCVAVPLAGVVEWLWLGTTIRLPQIIAIAGIVAGIALALFPEREKELTARRNYTTGILFGLMAAAGQAIGAVCSRKAFSLMEPTGGSGIGDFIMLGTTTGFIRLTGGILIAASFWLFTRFHKAWQTRPTEEHRNDPCGEKIRNVMLHAASGPVLGIICYQWALATTPSAIVQPIIAMSPLVILPMSWFLENDRLAPRAILGTAVAVGCVVVLACTGG